MNRLVRLAANPRATPVDDRRRGRGGRTTGAVPRADDRRRPGRSAPPADAVHPVGAVHPPGVRPSRPSPRRSPTSWRPGGRPGPDAELGDLLGALTQVATALRSGALPEHAWARAGVRAPRGVPSRTDLLARWPRQAVAVGTVLAAAELTATLGVAPAGLLDQVAATLAHDAEAAGQQRAALAGPVTTARLLAGLPAAGLLLGGALGADPLAVLLDGAGGTALLLVGGLLLLAGRRWTARCVSEARAVADR